MESEAPHGMGRAGKGVSGAEEKANKKDEKRGGAKKISLGGRKGAADRDLGVRRPGAQEKRANPYNRKARN